VCGLRVGSGGSQSKDTSKRYSFDGFFGFFIVTFSEQSLVAIFSFGFIIISLLFFWYCLLLCQVEGELLDARAS